MRQIDLMHKVLDNYFPKGKYLEGDTGDLGSIGKNIEKFIASEFTLNEEQWFKNGIDIPELGLEVKSRCIDASSYTQIGAITTTELEACIKYNIPFEETDFYNYSKWQYWVFYNEQQLVTETFLIDMSVHRDEYKRAYNLLINKIKAGPVEQLQTTPNLNKFFNIKPERVEPKEIVYFKADTKGMCWEMTSDTSWHLRVTQNKLKAMRKGCQVAKQLNKAVELV